VLSAVNTRNFDRVYLATMVQTHSQLIAQATQQILRAFEADGFDLTDLVRRRAAYMASEMDAWRWLVSSGQAPGQGTP